MNYNYTPPVSKITYERKVRKMRLEKISDDPLEFKEILIEDDETERLPRGV